MTTAQEPPASALVVSGLSKTYGVTRVLSDVDLTVAAGSVHALLGHNGSGKSTLIRIIAGVEKGEPGGTVTIGATTLMAEHTTAERAEAAGVVAVHQTPTLFPGMSIAENLAVGRSFPTRYGLVNFAGVRREAKQALATLGIDDLDVDRPVEDLFPGEQMLVCIARALGTLGDRKQILILDEPTAALHKGEVDVLHRVVRHLVADGGSVIYVSHHMDEVLGLADTLSVLRDGVRVVTCPTAGLSEDDVVTAMMGHPVERQGPASASTGERGDGTAADPAGDEPVLSLADVTTASLAGVSLTVRAGECVGVAGLVGDGPTELLRLLMGDDQVLAGTVQLHGRPYQPRNAFGAVKAGVTYVPADRAVDAVFPDLSVTENITAGQLRACSQWGLLSWRQVNKAASSAVTSFGVRCQSPAQLISTLSGGNQQRAVVARAIRSRPKLLVLSEPTQGVDVEARAEIHGTIRRACQDGLAVLMVSSDSEELCELSDRIMVLRRGRLTQVLQGEDRNERALAAAVYGVRESA